MTLGNHNLSDTNLSEILHVPKTTRNHQLTTFKDYDSENSHLFKTENLSARMSKVSDVGELYDPNEIINGFKHKFHTHSKSGFQQEFYPLVQSERPKIFVEGDEYLEEDSGINNLL